MVDSQITTSYFASSVSLNIAASSVAVTVKPFAVARSLIAWIPAGIESCRNAAVLLKTSALKVSSPCPGWARAVVAVRGIASAAIRASTRARIRVPCLRSWIIGSSSWVG